MRIKNLLRLFLLIGFLSFLDRPVQASHLYGGEFTYEYLGEFGSAANRYRYRITLKHYVSCVGNGITPNVTFNYYNFNGTSSGTFIRGVNQSSTLSPALSLPIPTNCPVTFPCIQIRTFVQIVDLPISFNGYYVTAVANARNSDITNINGGNMSLYMQIPPPVLNNPGSSPVFTDTAVVVIFAGDTATIINSAFDADGDKLIYAFNQPYDFPGGGSTFNTPPSPVTYRPGYSFAQPFGAGGYASINASTGLAKYFVPAIPGNTQDRKYVVSFQVKEYRQLPGVGDILIGSSIRDIQLVVKDLPPNNNTAPNFTFSGPKIINITEGAAIPPVTLTFSDPNPGQVLKVEVGGVLLDGPGGRNATFTAGNTTISSNTNPNNPASHLTVANGGTGTLNFTSICGQAGTYPLNITVYDNACPPGKKTESFSIVVDPYEGPDKINGDTTVCTNTTEAYNVISKPAATYNWEVQSGGTIVGSATTSNIQINWLTPGRHKVTAFETSTGSCIDSVSFFVNVTPGISLNLTASATAVCVGTPVTLNVSGGTGYTWSDGTNAFTGSSITVTPTATTTYTVTGSGITGCDGTNSVVIQVNPLPNVVGVDKTICLGQSTTLQANGANTYTWTDGTNTYTGNNISVSPTTTTTYSVTGTNTLTSCSNTDNQVTIVVNQNPTPSLAFLANEYCVSAAAVTLPAGTGISYTVNNAAATSFNPATLGVGSHTVIISETSPAPASCTATVTKTVTVNPLPAPAFVGLNPDYCLNDPVVNLAASLPGSTFTVNGTAATSFNPATLGVGNHTIVVSNTNALTTCTGTLSRTVRIKPLPVANFGPLATAYCLNDAPVALNTGAAGSIFSINGSIITSFNPATLGVGSHTVSVTTTSSPDNCSVTATRTVVVNPLPTPSLAFLANAYCQNDPAITLPTGTGISYSINNGTPIPGGPVNLSSLPVGSNTIVMSETANNANGANCTVTTSRTITINPIPLVDIFTGPTSVCPGTSGVKYQITNPRETTYQWSISAGHGTIVAGQGTTQITVNWNAAASATISVQAQNAQGCLSAATVLPVTINPILITPQPVGPLSVCQTLGGPTRYVMPNPTPGSSFAWTVTGGTIVGTANNDTIFVNWTTPGTGTIVVNESSSGLVNCFGSSPPLSVTVLPSPNPGLQIAGPATLCETSTGNQYALNGGTGSTYVWSLTQNGVTTPLPSTGNTVSLNTTTPGQYTLTATETNANNCAGLPIIKVITVTPRPVVTQIMGNSVVCPQNLNNQLYYVNGPSGNSYTWVVNGGTFTGATSNNDSIYVNFLDNSTVKSIIVTPSSATGCPGTAFTLPITIDRANLQLATVSTTDSDGKGVLLNFNMPGNSQNRQVIDIYRRETGSAAFIKVATVPNSQTSFPDNAVQTSDKVYEYRLVSFNECGDSLKTTVHNTMLLAATGLESAKTVTLNWNPYLGWGTNGVERYEVYMQADNGTIEKVDVNVSGGASSVTLNNISGRGFNLCFRIKAISKDNRTSWSNFDCLGFENKLKFYNVFTPNNDKANDSFIIENITLYPGNELSVYNRWGTEIYRKKDYDNKWDGKNQSAGTYYYLLKLADGTSYKGWVEIIK